MSAFQPSQDPFLLPGRLGDRLQDELGDNEHILWLGQPIPRRFALTSLPAVLFAIPWTAFALFWIAGASGFKVPDFSKGFDFFPLFGVPFVLIGLAMLSAPLWMIRKAKRTAYVITDRRAIIFSGGFSINIRSFSPEAFGNTERRQRADGSGDIVFADNLSYTGDNCRPIARAGFIAIPNVKEAERLLRDVAAAHQPPPAAR